MIIHKHLGSLWREENFSSVQSVKNIYNSCELKNKEFFFLGLTHFFYRMLSPKPTSGIVILKNT